MSTKKQNVLLEKRFLYLNLEQYDPNTIFVTNVN